MADFFERLFITITTVGIAIGGFGAFSYMSIRSIGTGPVSDINYTAGIMIGGFVWRLSVVFRWLFTRSISKHMGGQGSADYDVWAVLLLSYFIQPLSSGLERSETLVPGPIEIE
jgi:hypothetical protein